MRQNSFSIQLFEAKRMRFESVRSFDEVLLHLRNLVGTATPTTTLATTLQQVNSQEAGDVVREHFEKVIQSQVGESGFMRFYEIDHGAWLPLFNIQRKAVRLILGNPLIAITMIQHDITTGLFAPVELLLFENESGEGSTVIYDLPSSLMVIERNPALLEAAQELDRKLQILVSNITGVEVDRAPEQLPHQN